jgi:hypothetical protein
VCFVFFLGEEGGGGGGGGRSRELCVNSSLTQDNRVLLAVLLKMQFFWDMTPCC